MSEGDDNALYWAARGCHTSIVEVLLTADILPEAKTYPDRPAKQIEGSGDPKDMGTKWALWHVAGGYFEPADLGPIIMQLWKEQSGAHEREFEIAKLLLKYGADVNGRGRAGLTALHVVIRQAIHLKAKAPMVHLLLAGGADMSLKDEYGLTPLHYAACLPEVEANDIIMALLQHGAVVGTADNEVLMPLHYTARNGALEASKILLDHGANCCAVSKGGMIPLTTAASTPMSHNNNNSYQSIIKSMLRRNSHTISYHTSGWNSLHAATRHSLTTDCSLVKTLTDNGMSVSAMNYDGWTPLLYAVFNAKCLLTTSPV